MTARSGTRRSTMARPALLAGTGRRASAPSSSRTVADGRPPSRRRALRPAGSGDEAAGNPRGLVRWQGTTFLNEYWHVAFYVTARGMATGPIPYGDRAFDVAFDFVDHNVQIRASDGAT